MQEAQLTQFLMEIGLWPLKRSGTNNFSTACLFPEKHKDGTDRRPSATISFDQGESWFRCYGCGTRKPIISAVREAAIRDLSKREWLEAIEKFRSVEDSDVLITAVRKMQVPVDALIDCTTGLKTLLTDCPVYPKAVLDFLESKNVSADTAKKFYVAFVPEGHVDRFLARGSDGKPKPVLSDSIFIPTLVKNSNGKTICVGGQARPLDRGTGSKYFTMYPHSIGKYLYAQHLADKVKDKAAFLVEGAFDVMHLWQEGFRAYGLFGLNASHHRCIKLKKMSVSEAVVFLDPDQSGISATEKVVASLQNENINATSISYPKQPKDCTTEELNSLAPQTRQE